MRRYITTADGSRSHEVSELSWIADESSEERQIVCYPQHLRQRIIGFGGALTEASARVFASMPAELQDEALLRCFGPAARGGNAYTFCRTHLQSCDFACGTYAYVSRPRRGRPVLDTFSIERDQSLLIPFIRCCMALQPELTLVAAPWSPPAFMKTNRSMCRGGKLKPESYSDWAQVLARAVSAWRAEGMPLAYLSVQNEPMATQTWDSCIYTAAEEARFAAQHLLPALDASGVSDVKLLAWDHNKERLVARAGDIACTLKELNKAVDDVFSGFSFHWYTGDHFEAIRVLRDLYPEMELIHTEGCAAFSAGDSAAQAADAEHYAHDMIGDLDAGANGYIDWNILLDEQGGPNHVGNYCDAPLMYDRSARRLVVNRSFDYIGHMTRYIRPGAQVFPTSSYTAALETLGARNPDGTHALVVLNRGGSRYRATLRTGSSTAHISVPAHSIQTIVW